jgi:hypothetical protein
MYPKITETNISLSSLISNAVGLFLTKAGIFIDSLTLAAAPKVGAIAPHAYRALFASILLKVSANTPLGSLRAA